MYIQTWRGSRSVVISTTESENQLEALDLAIEPKSSRNLRSLAVLRVPEVVEASQKDYGVLKGKFSTFEKLKEMPLTEVRRCLAQAAFCSNWGFELLACATS